MIATAPRDDDGLYSESYPWAMALGSKNLWFGTAANVLCGGANPGINRPINAYLPPRDNPTLTCQRQNPEWIPDGAPMNWRPPAVYALDRKTHALEKIALDTSTVLGFRAAGSIGDQVLMVSEGLKGSPDFGKLLVYVFDDASKKQTKVCKFSNGNAGEQGDSGYAMPRTGVVIKNKFYFPYRNKAEGLIVHLAEVGTDCSFRSLGHFPARGGVVTAYKDRLVFGAWSDRNSPAAIYVSSPYPFDSWKAFFSFDQYDPDDGASMTYDTGAMTEHDGWLYFGSINGPLLAAWNEFRAMGPVPNPLNAVLGERSVSLFRARNIDTDQPTVELLYGRAIYPAHVSPIPEQAPFRPGAWIVRKTGFTPKCGPAGFGNPNNRYIWSMAAYKDQVYLGTMDMTTTILPPRLRLFTQDFAKIAGGDLYVLDDTGCGKAVTTNGFGNPFVYGFRNLVAAPEGLYVGGANPFNKIGGWVIWKLE